MKEQELIEWIQLINSENIGPVTFYKLLEKYGSVANALNALGKKQPVFDKRNAEYELEKALKNHVTILSRLDPAYPETLRQLNDAPPLIYVKGNPSLLNYPAAVSIVGARNASINGRKIASKIAFDLTNSHVLVISGLARGIDAAAHKGALYAHNREGTTLAVLGTGVDIPYPAENSALYEQIADSGAIVSEYPLGTKPQAANFPRRNRLVSALSSGTLVVEASLNSGSLITARMALEQGKDIFAVPGSPLEGRSAGSNKLIREGAILTESADDILEVLSLTQNRQIKNFGAEQTSHDTIGQNIPNMPQGNLFAKPLDNAAKSDDIPLQEKNRDASTKKYPLAIVTNSRAKAKDTVSTKAPLTDFIPASGIDIDELIRSTGFDTVEVMTKVTELELDGIIERISGGILVLKSKKQEK